LVDFAVALMTILDQINRESFQRFKLRMGEAVLQFIDHVCMGHEAFPSKNSGLK
jgi:hypothetical protein